ncbi:choline/carnitine O-acyltransferase [Pseudomonas sp.]|uniref:choline/carnitine O-acyltransferase n=1 Tax=Pseudomonas sp. TaxID=306 RepID=UPI002606FDA4|nr:choline/carnitine O-acyltransferase [Pseudomonas sp.]
MADDRSVTPVLLIAGMEMRSLGTHQSQGDTSQICYSLTLRPDMDFLRDDDVASFSELISNICFKTARLSVIQLQAGDRADVALAFLGAVETHNGSLAAFDLVDAAPSLSDPVRKALIGHPHVHYRNLDPETELVDQGFDEHSYDVVLATTVGSLNHATHLLKPSGMLVLILDGNNLDNDNDSFDNALEKVSTTLDVQLTFQDRAQGKRCIVVARPRPASLANSKTKQVPSQIRILSNSLQQRSPSWIASLQAKLYASGASDVVLDKFNIDSTAANTNAGDDSLYIVVDDHPEQPILSDANHFAAVTALLKQEPARILWIAPNDPLPMHQITGVARTAHAENDQLRLSVVHVASALLAGLEQNTQNEKQENLARLLNILTGCVTRLVADTFHHEREYQVHVNGVVHVPRLHRSEQLNRAICSSDTGQFHIEPRRFIDSSRPPLVLSPTTNTHGNSTVVFIEDGNAFASPLHKDEIEVETHVSIVSITDPYSKDAAPGFGYSGTVTRVGATVTSVAVGDRVVAISPLMGASRLRIPESHAGRPPASVSSTTGAVFITSTLAACYALYKLARLPPSGTVLIHGAFSDLGRAAIAAARGVNARIIATARDAREARLLTDQLGIGAQNVLITRPSLSRRGACDVFRSGQVDAILQISNGDGDSVPAEALSLLKASRCLVVIGRDSSGGLTAALPLNTTIYHYTPTGLHQANPERTARLVAQAIATLHHLPTNGVDLRVRDVAYAAEALRLVRTRVTSRIILRAEPDSVVHAVVPEASGGAWGEQEHENASYIVAGGLGDLGWRIILLLAHRGARHFVTLSRRDTDPEDIKKLQTQLDAVASGCHLHCVSCDITSDASLKDAVAMLDRAGVPPVRGVVQSAFLMHDRTLDTMTYEDFLIPTRVKVQGTLALERAFSSPHLAFFLLMSSAVTVVGTSGQANYNAGNAVQDALAQARTTAPCHFMSLNIGLVQDTSSHEASLEAWSRSLRRAGLKPVGPVELLRCFDYLLGAVNINPDARHVHQAAIGFDATSLAAATARNGTVRSAMFSHVFDSALSASAETSDTTGTHQSFAQVLVSNGPISEFIASSIVGRLALLISADPASIESGHGSLLDLGLDSLVAIELRNWIMAEFDAPLQSSEILVDQTINALAQKVTSRSKLVIAAAQPSNQDGTTGTDEATATIDSTLVSTAEYVCPPLPIPLLDDTLQLFEDSRLAFDSPDAQRVTATAVAAFKEGLGPVLQQRVEEAGPDAICDAFDRLINLEKREPLHDLSFYFLHSLNAPKHSQVMRAAILTVAAMEYARLIATGELAPHMLNGVHASSTARDWLFYANRRPGVGIDHMERHAPNQNVVVLRRGHVFLLDLPGFDTSLQLAAVQSAYTDIMQTSQQACALVCTLTGDYRDSWAVVRTLLLSH